MATQEHLVALQEAEIARAALRRPGRSLRHYHRHLGRQADSRHLGRLSRLLSRMCPPPARQAQGVVRQLAAQPRGRRRHHCTFGRVSRDLQRRVRRV